MPMFKSFTNFLSVANAVVTNPEGAARRVDYVRRAPEEYRRQRAAMVAREAADNPLNRSDPFIYGRTYTHAYEGII